MTETGSSRSHRRWYAPGIFVLIFVLITAPAACNRQTEAPDAPASQPSDPNDESDFEAIDPNDLSIEEEYRYPRGGPNDTRDILVVEDGFFAATGRGVVHYRMVAGKPAVVAAYGRRDGLPDENCLSLKSDSEGGVWVRCEDGVAVLAKGARKWIAYTENNGLVRGKTTDMAISPRGDRVWVTSWGGLATASVRDRQWKSYPIKNPIDILVHPDGGAVWCRRLVPSACDCGREILGSQFGLKTGLWTDIPDSEDSSHMAPGLAYFSTRTNRLWVSRPHRPPLLYDPATKTTKSWHDRYWERTNHRGVVNYTEWFGQILPFSDGSGRTWLATNTGLWEYDPNGDQWRAHPLEKSGGDSGAILIPTRNSKTLYWACGGVLAAYDIASEKWNVLWQSPDRHSGEEPYALALTPDEKYLWWVREVGDWGRRTILVMNVHTEESVALTGKDIAGVRRTRTVRFDPTKKIALIATPRGVVCSSYAGKVAATAKRAACPISYDVTRFVFAPDGSEVWCLMADDDSDIQKPAVILYPHQRRWEEIPDPGTGRGLYDVIFSKEGKTTWLSLDGYDVELPGLLERTKRNRKWRPARFKLPKNAGQITEFWLTPNGDELWLNSGYSGLLRIKLATGQVSQYAKHIPKNDPNGRRFPLAAGEPLDLVFTGDDKYAVCSATSYSRHGITVIDLKSGNSANYASKKKITRLEISADQNTVRGFLDPMEDFFDLMEENSFDIQRRAWIKPGPRKKPLTTAPADIPDAPAGGFVLLPESLFLAGWLTGGDIAVRGPLTGDRIVCVLRHEDPKLRGWYLFDVRSESLKKLHYDGPIETTVIQAGPKGLVWAAIPGGVISIDPKSGKVTEFD